jgi:two-component system NtrC family response regulator
VCATHRDLARRVAEGAFRADLRYRLDQLRVHIPPLRDRRDDVPSLARHLLARISREMERPKLLEDSALTRLVEYDWPGNVRELYAVLCRAAVDAEGERVGPEHLELGMHGATRASTPTSGFFDIPPAPRLPRDVEPTAARAMLDACGGNLSRAARALGVARSTLRDRLRRSDPPGDPQSG